MNPITENLALVDRGQVERHLAVIFGNHDWHTTPSQNVCVRGIGEKGTVQEGVFREDIFINPHSEFLPFTDAVGDHCERWSQYHVAAFVVPALLAEGRATAANVAGFYAVSVDLDSPPIEAKLDWLRNHAGEPTMVVKSGGYVDGEEKVHVWYALQKIETNIGRVVQLRDALARKSGGDLAFGIGVEGNPFGRSHQPIRIAGSVHAKSGKATQCTIREENTQTYAIESLEQCISEAEPSPWAHPGSVTKTESLPLQTTTEAPQGMFTASTGLVSYDTSDKPPALTRDIHQGGDDTENRWTVFNEVAGTNLYAARRGDITIEEARSITHGWMLQHMHPAWNEGQFQMQWQGMVNKDQATNGRIKEPSPPELLPLPEPYGEEEGGIFAWSASRWICDPKPNHTFLVDRLIVRGEPHSFVAEGGSGKTFMAADLALKVAATGLIPEEFDWCGQKILNGGTCVLILCEDSKTEMHRRLMEIDVYNLIPRLGKRLIVLPMPALGGAFTVAQFNKKTGEIEPTAKWAMMVRELERIKDLALVCIDTFASINMGDENSAVAVQNSLNMVAKVTGMGAALVITHHIRKQGQEPIRNAEDMLGCIRGSSAFPSFFRINMGMWHAGDYARRMKAMGAAPRPRALYRFAILKCNINGLMQSERTLMRDETGLLVDVTGKDAFSTVNIPERLAWLVLAAKEAASSYHPYTIGGKNAANGFYKRRTELPMILRDVGSGEFIKLIEMAQQKELLVPCAAKGSKSKNCLDVPNGLIAGDEEGAELQAGAYTPPNWEKFAFDSELGEVIGRAAKTNWEAEFSPRSQGTKENAPTQAEAQQAYPRVRVERNVKIQPRMGIGLSPRVTPEEEEDEIDSLD